MTVYAADGGKSSRAAFKVTARVGVARQLGALTAWFLMAIPNSSYDPRVARQLGAQLVLGSMCEPWGYHAGSTGLGWGLRLRLQLRLRLPLRLLLRVRVRVRVIIRVILALWLGLG